MFKKLFLIVVVCALGYYYWINRSISHGPGVVAPKKPVQELTRNIGDIEYKDYILNPRAKITFEARVLSVENYSDTYADLAPTDVVFAWGPMSDERNLDKIMTRQSERSMHWDMANPPIDKRKMWSHAANMHLISPTEQIRDQIQSLKEGHIVSISGYLVDAQSTQSGWKLKSSLKRTDRGRGSSELVWIKSMSIR